MPFEGALYQAERDPKSAPAGNLVTEQKRIPGQISVRKLYPGHTG